MTRQSEHLRVASNGARTTHEWEPVGIIKERGPTALTECWDCGGPLTPANGHGFVCATRSGLWRRHWIPSRWWERMLMHVLPARYRWRCYRLDRAQHVVALLEIESSDRRTRA